MSLRKSGALILVTAIAAWATLPSGVCVAATSLADQTAADRAALTRAVQRYDEAEAKAAQLDARVREASAELDRLVAEQTRCQAQLAARVTTMYRSNGDGTLALLLSASTIQDLAVRLDLVERIARQDAANLAELKAARVRARESAAELLTLQADQAKSVDALATEVAAAKTALASSESALREYEAKMAAAAAARAAAARAAEAAARARAAASQQLTGTGDWQTAVASHYSINFTGRGANGELIGPYTMMVAHRTLPFGTLVEFEYNGTRAVARVADRGPYVPGRDWDLGPGVARVLGFRGVHEVRYRIIGQ